MVEPRQLAMLISEEHLQLQAVFLAFLTPEISAAVLSYLNESVQNEILYRVAKLNDVNRDVVDELDRLIERGLSVLSEHGSKVKASNRRRISSTASRQSAGDPRPDARTRRRGVGADPG